MNAPPLDPLRPLHLAIRSTALLGIVSAGFGLVMTIVFGYFNRMQMYRPPFIALGLVVWFIPGVLFITYSQMLRQRDRRGAIGAMAVGLADLLFALTALAASCLLPPVSPIPIILSALWAAAVMQMLWHLRQSLAVLPADGRRHGFEVATPMRVLKENEDGR